MFPVDPHPSGMLNGAKGVANDACLYGEDTVIRVLNNSISGDVGDKVGCIDQHAKRALSPAAPGRLAGGGAFVLCSHPRLSTFGQQQRCTLVHHNLTHCFHDLASGAGPARVPLLQ